MNSCKILILEDNEADADLIKICLQRSDISCETVLAKGKKEFITALQQHQFDIILSDHALPQFSSFEALEEIKKQQLQIPFILVTGTVSEEFAVDILKKGADDYILKNNLTRLPKAITQAIEINKIKNEKIKTENDLLIAHKKILFHLENAPLGFIEWDNKLLVKSWSKRAEEIFGWTEKEVIEAQKKGVSLVNTEDMPLMIQIGVQLLSGEVERNTVQHRDFTKAGKVIWCQWFNSVLKDGNGKVVSILSLVLDITEQKNAEAAIKQVNKELRELSSHLQSVREEERLQIAQNIHDELGQQLTGLKIDIEWMNTKISEKDVLLKQKAKELIPLIRGTIQTVRRISSNLRPSMLDDLGLVAALEWQSQETEKRFDIKVNFISDIPDTNLSIEVTTALFRIYQEALTNAIRHANAHEIKSYLQIQENSIILEVEDNGKGIDAEKKRKNKSFGLLGIKERTFALGGTFELKSQIGKGTLIRIVIPL